MRAPADEGFTVIELMIAMLIMLVITVPLVASFVIGIQTGLGSQQDVTNSADAQLLGYYFDIDVASAELVSPTSAACGGAGTVVELQWTDGTSQAAAYRAVRDTARETELAVTTPLYRLERALCSNGGPATVTVIARTLTAPPTATCDDALCTVAQKPRRISLSVTERSTQQSDTGTDTFTFGVTASRRVTP